MTDMSQQNPNKNAGETLEMWFERAERVWPYVTGIFDRALDWYALYKADPKSVDRVKNARKSRS